MAVPRFWLPVQAQLLFAASRRRNLFCLPTVGLSTTSCLVVKSVTEGGAADGSADALDGSAGTISQYSLGTWSFGLDFTVVLDTISDLGKFALQKVTALHRPFTKKAVTYLGTLVCSGAESGPEGGVSYGSANAPSHCTSTIPIGSLGAWASALDSTVVLDNAWNLGNTSLKDVVAMKRLVIKVAIPEFSAPAGLGAGGVTQGGTADGTADARASSAWTAHPCGLGALTFGLDLALCLIAQGTTESSTTDGRTQALAHWGSMDTPCNLGASVFGLDPPVLSATDCDLGVTTKKSLP